MLDIEAIKTAYGQSTFGEWFPTYETAKDGDRRLAGVGTTDQFTGMIDGIFSVSGRWDDTMDGDCTFVSLINNQWPTLLAEVARLQRIEQAARAHKAAWDDGTNSTMAHDTREALWAALEGE